MRLQHRSIKRASRRAGYTLVEVVVAMLITSVMVTSVFSVTLTSKFSGDKNDRRVVASQAARRLASHLRNFVTGCDCNPSTGVCSGTTSCAINGPTPTTTPSPGLNVASWYMNCPTCAPAIVDCWPAPSPVYNACGGGNNVYALTFGAHAVKGLLPTEFEAAPYNARVVYTVTSYQPMAYNVTTYGRTLPQVTVDVQWTEPAR